MDKLGQSFICGALFFFFYHTSPLPATSPHTSPQFSWVSNCRKKIDLLSPPGISRAFDWSLTPYSGDFDPKWGPPSRAFDFCVKRLVSGREQKDFVILSLSMCSKNGTCLDQNWKKNIKLTKLLHSIFWDLKWEYSCECLRRTWVTVSFQVWLHHPPSYRTNIHGIRSLLTNTHTRPKSKLQMRKRMNIFSPS